MSIKAKQAKNDARGNRQNSSGVGNQFQPTPVPGSVKGDQTVKAARNKSKKKNDAGTKS